MRLMRKDGLKAAKSVRRGQEHNDSSRLGNNRKRFLINLYVEALVIHLLFTAIIYGLITILGCSL